MRRSIFVGFLAAPAALLTSASAVQAHHSFAAQYDPEKPVTMQGMVTKVEWLNPHVYFYLDVSDSDGNVTRWAFEMAAPSALRNRGWSRNSMTIGDIVEVDGVLARDGSPLVNAFTVLLTGTGELLTASTTQVPGR